MAFTIDNRARPGELLKRDARKRRPVTAARQESGSHLAFVRALPCIISGRRPVDAAHVRLASRLHGKPLTGIGVKPDDRWTLPLHHELHMAQHAFPDGELAFWRHHGVRDPLVVCMRLWEVSGDVDAGERVIADAIAATGDRT